MTLLRYKIGKSSFVLQNLGGQGGICTLQKEGAMPFVVIYRARNTPDEKEGWEMNYHVIDAEAEEKAIAELRGWAKKVIENAPGCIHPRMILTRFTGIHDAQSGIFRTEADLEVSFKAIAQALSGDFEGAFRTLERIPSR